jgi:F-type H+-transporting ATPase subunit epsilon
MADRTETTATAGSGALTLVVTSHERKLLETRCDEVTLPGREGDLGVLPGHAALIATLRPGVLGYRSGGRASHVVLSTGFCQVYEDRVTVLADRAWLPDEVDAKAARARAAELERAVERAEPGELETMQDQLAEAQAMISVAG